MILQVIDALSAGGAERVLVELSNALHARGVKVGVCVTRSSLQLAGDLHPDVPLLTLHRTRRWDVGALQRFARECRRLGVRVLHAHSRSSVQLCAVVKLMMGGDVRLVFHDHFGLVDVDQNAPMALRFIGRFMIDHYFGVTPPLCNWAIDRLGVPARRCDVLSNAIELSRFAVPRASRRTCPDGRVSAVMVANLRPQKDHPLLFRVLASSPILRERLHVTLLGGADESEHAKRCRAMCEQLGVAENVTFAGSCDDVPEVLANADIGLLTSRSEAGPVALLEYMASALPVVVTATGFITMRAAALGLPGIVSMGNEEAFRATLEELVLLPEAERRARGALGLAIVRDNFHMEHNTDLVSAIYEDITAPAARRRAS